MASGLSRFQEALAQAGVELEVRRFPEGTRTAEDAARSIGCEVAQIVKSLVFAAAGRPVLVLIGGDRRVDPQRLQAVAGGRVARAGADEVREATGYAIGGVPPFGHARQLATYMDRGLLAQPLVWAAAGRPDEVFAISPERLRELSGAAIADLGERPGS